MYDSSRLVTLPASWQIFAGILVPYGVAACLILGSNNFWRAGTVNFVRWPWQFMVAGTSSLWPCSSSRLYTNHGIARVLVAVLGFPAISPSISRTDSLYLLLTLKYFWDLGFMLLLIGVLLSALKVCELEKKLAARTVQCFWLLSMVIIPSKEYGSEMFIAWQDAKSAVDALSQAGRMSLSVVRICARVSFIIGVVMIGITTFLFGFAAMFFHQRARFNSAHSAQIYSFFLALSPLAIYTGFLASRLWYFSSPSIPLFAFSQLLPDLIVFYIYIGIGYLISRWDFRRLTDLRTTQQATKKYWQDVLLDAINFTHKMNATGSRYVRGKPWIVTRAERCYNSLAYKSDRQDLLARLVLLQRVAAIVAEHLILEPDAHMSILHPTENRRIDIEATTSVVAEKLVYEFCPMKRSVAESLANEWTAVFTMTKNVVSLIGEDRLASQV